MTNARSVLGISNSPGGKLSNHSVRKTSITTLLDSDVPPTFVKPVTLTALNGIPKYEAISFLACSAFVLISLFFSGCCTNEIVI